MYSEFLWGVFDMCAMCFPFLILWKIGQTILSSKRNNCIIYAPAAKDSKIEELTQQHHADRVKMHELIDKAANFDTELVRKNSLLFVQPQR